MRLWERFLENKGRETFKCTHYFPIYERYFAPWRNRSLVFMEIGVNSGGSLQMWQRYFGPLARIVGIDINPECKKCEEPGIFVRIGDQSSPEFLQSVLDEFGMPDIVLDDGSHKMNDILASFNFLYPRQHKNALYVIEDLCTSYWEEYGGGVHRQESFINIAKSLIDRLNADHTRGAIPADSFSKETLGMSFYDSMVVFEKGDVWWKEPLQTGRKAQQGLRGILQKILG
jgi:hypothetical protein